MVTIRRGFACTITLLVILALSALTASAQFTSSIEGTVFDPNGAVIKRATVTIQNEETGTTQSVETSSAGYYRFSSLPAKRFTVKASAQGFKTVIQGSVQLQVAETKTINFSMQLGETAAEVTVTAAPLVETSEGRVSGLINDSQVRNLPLSGRNFFNLVVLTPGVTGLASGGGQAYAQASNDIYNNEYGVNLNANGARAESNSFLVDSASINSSQRNGVANINPNAESVQEVRVAVNNFSAEYGRNGAALVNIITKQGTNDWHGSAGFYHTNNRLQSRNLFQNKVPVFRRNEIAWGLGGPIRKNSTFFFASMDILRSSVATGRAASVPTLQFIQWLQQNKPNNVSTGILKTYPASVTPTQGFVTARTMAGGDCSKLPSLIGNIPCDLPVTGIGSFATGLPRDGLQWATRVDHTFNKGNDRLYGSFNRTTLNQVLFGSPFVYPDFNTIEPTYSVHFNMNWTHTFSPTFVNEAGFSFTRPYGDAKVNHPEVPGITVTGIEAIQTGWGPNIFVQNNFEWRDVASITRGSHSLKFGGNFNHERADHESARVFNRPQYSFLSVFDFANDKPDRQTNIGFDPATGKRVEKLFSLIRTGSVSAFVQDDWKIRPNLTLNLGFRWENFFNPSDAESSRAISYFMFNGGTDFNSRIANASVILGKNLLNHSLNTFNPRFAFAWDPRRNGKMSIRGGLGVFHDRPSNQLYDGEFGNVPTIAVASAFANAPPVLPVFALGTSGNPPYGFPLPPGLRTGLDSHNGLLNGRASVTVADPNLKAMSILNYFLGVQQELARDFVIELNYIGSIGRHAYVRYNVNRFNGDLIKNKGVFTGLQPGFANITYGQSSESTSYNGATVSLRKRFGRGLNFASAYTFGKAIDISSKLDGGDYPDALNQGRQRGLADFDIRHKLALSLVWNLPTPSFSSTFLNKLVGGWAVNTVTILQSGPPFSVVCTDRFRPVFDSSGNVIGNTGCDYNADGTNFDFPNAPASAGSLNDWSRSQFLNGVFRGVTFPAPALGLQGSLGRNTFRNPNFANTDFSIMRIFGIPWFLGNEGAKLQFRTEFFNLFNRVNLGSVNGTINSPLFGKSTSAFSARDIQFVLRIEF